MDIRKNQFRTRSHLLHRLLLVVARAREHVLDARDARPEEVLEGILGLVRALALAVRGAVVDHLPIARTMFPATH